MAHWLLTYDLADDYLDRRGEHRAGHLAYAWAAVERGELLLGGALDPVEGAVLLFQAEEAGTVEAFAAADPYVLAGLVTGWRVHRWTTVVGEMAATPVHL